VLLGGCDKCVAAVADERWSTENTGAEMADQERNTRELSTTTLEHGLQVMMDLLTDYFINKATRTEWVVEIQKRFTGRDGKLRRGWSDDSIDRKINKLEEMRLITGGRGQGAYYSAVATAQPGRPVSARKLSASENAASLLDALEAAKQQLLKAGKSSAA
jgi:hypothetical protein